MKKHPVRASIFAILLTWAQHRNGATPTQRYLWTLYKKQARRSMAWGNFQRHLAALEKDGMIRRENGFIIIVRTVYAPDRAQPTSTRRE